MNKIDFTMSNEQWINEQLIINNHQPTTNNQLQLIINDSTIKRFSDLTTNSLTQVIINN